MPLNEKIVTQKHSLLFSLSEVREKPKSEGFVQLKIVDYYTQQLVAHSQIINQQTYEETKINSYDFRTSSFPVTVVYSP